MKPSMLAHIFIFTLNIHVNFICSLPKSWLKLPAARSKKNVPFRHGAELQAPQETVIQHHPGHKSPLKTLQKVSGIRGFGGPKHAETLAFLLQPVQPATLKPAIHPSTATCKAYVFQWLLGLHPATDRCQGASS